MSYNSKYTGQDVDKAVGLVLQNSDKWGSGSSTQIDTTLTKAGQAADAKVVGDKISKLSDKIANIGFSIPEGTPDGAFLRMSGGSAIWQTLTNLKEEGA